MRVLVIGSGGREHAICHKLMQSNRVDKIYCAPANAGISSVAQAVDIGILDFEGLRDFAKDNNIDMTIVGMDDALCNGIVDVFLEAGLKIFGPTKKAAILEGSKAFSKGFMKKYSIPTADFECFDDFNTAKEYIEAAKFPIVIKADGLALGKGVLICKNRQEAESALSELMVKKAFAGAGEKVVIEEFIEGREVSILSFCDGKSIKLLSSAQDHKKALDGDKGLNTGGMGTFSPSPFYTEEIDEFCKENIYQKTLDGLKAEGIEFKGVIFFGLMITDDGVKVLEYNVRFGDPETQVVLPRLKNDIVDIFEACIDGSLDKIEPEFIDDAAVCVILASDGYPKEYKKGFAIKGVDKFENNKDYFCFHAATAFNDVGELVTNGGRVLGATALGKDLKEARKKAYAMAEHIDFENKYMRKDIGLSIEEEN